MLDDLHFVCVAIGMKAKHGDINSDRREAIINRLWNGLLVEDTIMVTRSVELKV